MEEVGGDVYEEVFNKSVAVEATPLHYSYGRRYIYFRSYCGVYLHLDDLGKLDVKVEDEDQALLLLCSLPTQYKSLRDMMIYGREKISLEDVKGNLQAKLHLDNEITSVDKGSQGVG